jgi:hypothetical protein
LFADQGKIIVEIQRKCGCSFQFREAARAVLRSAKGVTTQAPKRKLSIPSCIPRDTMEQEQQRAESCLEVALQQLCSMRLDSQLIGMESLEQITRCESAGHISRKILEGSCLGKVLSAAQDDVTNARAGEIEGQHVSVMKRWATTVLANALCALSQSGQLEVVLRDCAELKTEHFICNLVETLGDASSLPHEATQAARCIQHLLTSKDVLTFLDEMSAISVVSDACSTGAQRNSHLEQESKKLKVQLSSV